MSLHYSLYDMSDNEDDPERGMLSDDEEPQAIEEIVEGEVEPFDPDAGPSTADDDLDGLFGDPDAPPPDSEKQEVAEKKKRKKSNIPRLNAERLKGPNGIAAIDEIFKDFKMRGRKHEQEDLDEILNLMQTWTHRMYPRFPFPFAIDQIERQGSKMSIKNYMLRNRNQKIEPDVIPVRLFEDDNAEEAATAPAVAADDPASPRRGYDSDDGPSTSAARDSPRPSTSAARDSPKTVLSPDQLERIRLNREAALRLRAEKMKQREAAANGGSSAGNGAAGDTGSPLVNGNSANGLSANGNGSVANGDSIPANSIVANDDSIPVNGFVANGISEAANGTITDNGSLHVNGKITDNGSLHVNGKITDNGSPLVNGKIDKDVSLTIKDNDMTTNDLPGPSRVRANSVSNMSTDDSSDSETPMDVDPPLQSRDSDESLSR